MIMVEAASPLSPGARALLEASHTLMNRMFPAGVYHYLDFEALQAPHIHFYRARKGDVTLGTGALAVMDGYGEVKSMFTDPDARGKGVAAALLRQIEDTARTLDLPFLRLETGTGLNAAHRLYARHGFEPCGPFGSYDESPHSVFMAKPLG